jgi:hypothetical protein
MLAYFQGFVNSCRKWHILPALSIEFDRIFLYFHRKILTYSGYIMLDLVYVYIYSYMILYRFVDILRDFIKLIVKQ